MKKTIKYNDIKRIIKNDSNSFYKDKIHVNFDNWQIVTNSMQIEFKNYTNFKMILGYIENDFTVIEFKQDRSIHKAIQQAHKEKIKYGLCLNGVLDMLFAKAKKELDYRINSKDNFVIKSNLYIFNLKHVDYLKRAFGQLTAHFPINEINKPCFFENELVQVLALPIVGNKKVKNYESITVEKL